MVCVLIPHLALQNVKTSSNYRIDFIFIPKLFGFFFFVPERNEMNWVLLHMGTKTKQKKQMIKTPLK